MFRHELSSVSEADLIISLRDLIENLESGPQVTLTNQEEQDVQKYIEFLQLKGLTELAKRLSKFI